jgi:hypothetical protein
MHRIHHGRIERGMDVLNTPIPLPDGTRVRVEVESPDAQFWRGKTVEELALEQGVESVASVSDLVIDWPEEDSVDEFLSVIREVRQ